jgi:hypothetical protein
VGDIDRLILWEQPEGVPWIVGFWAGKGSIAVIPAPPEWASPQLVEAVEGALCATIEGWCSRCEAVAPLSVVPAGQVVHSDTRVPHAAWCPRSNETLKRLEEACRPPGVRWVADSSEETMNRLSDYINALSVRLLRERDAANGPLPAITRMPCCADSARKLGDGRCFSAIAGGVPISGM